MKFNLMTPSGLGEFLVVAFLSHFWWVFALLAAIVYLACLTHTLVWVAVVIVALAAVYFLRLDPV